LQPETISGALPFLGSLARSPRSEDRLLWLRVATDYVLRAETIDARFLEAFEVHFSACLEGCDEDCRLSVARKLLTREHTPTKLLTILASFGGESAQYVLSNARDFPREALWAAAAHPETARAVARRDDLDEDMVDAILASGDPEAPAILAENPGAPLSAAVTFELAALAHDRLEANNDRRLAEALLARQPSRLEIASLFLEANSEQRKGLLLAAQRAELGRARGGASVSAPRESIDRLERYALAGEIEDFAAALAKTLGAALELARRIVSDRSGEALAVALSAINAPNDVSVRILTATDMRDGGGYRRLGALARLQDALSPSAARRIISSLVAVTASRERIAPATAPTPAPSARPSVPASTERRPRPAPSPRMEEPASQAVQRRRRAFALLAAQGSRKD